MTLYPSESYKIRKLDIRFDQAAVADLIENCFGNYIDPDGKSYLDRIRQAARNRKNIQWLKGANEMLSYPLSGFICETSSGDIVGNLSIIPFERNGKWTYLIANVAVKDTWRQQGIAKKLTTTALNHLSQQGVQAVWLQVREDNDAAVHLYQTFGFQEFSRRTNWLKDPHVDEMSLQLPENIQVGKRKTRHWLQHAQLLHRIFPQDIAWNLNLHVKDFAPGFLSTVKSTMQINELEHYEAVSDHQTIGFASWQARKLYADTIWFVANRDFEYEASLALLQSIESKVQNRQRPLMINYPAGRNQKGFQETGFIALNTLIWMKRPVWNLNEYGG
ncbi:MAG: GNAT family N-acetyltransferase [Anaerolineaceae bacterium]|nr:GNAT family N-acetyltransferase [Anaerolineaceae bacterium]